MNATETRAAGRRSWVAALALVSLVLPMAAMVLADGANLSNYRQVVATLVLGLAAATGTLVFNRALTPAWLRWLSVGLAGIGVVVATYLLLALIGTCGLTVLWGTCAP